MTIAWAQKPWTRSTGLDCGIDDRGVDFSRYIKVFMAERSNVILLFVVFNVVWLGLGMVSTILCANYESHTEHDLVGRRVVLGLQRFTQPEIVECIGRCEQEHCNYEAPTSCHATILVFFSSLSEANVAKSLGRLADWLSVLAAQTQWDYRYFTCCSQNKLILVTSYTHVVYSAMRYSDQISWVATQISSSAVDEVELFQPAADSSRQISMERSCPGWECDRHWRQHWRHIEWIVLYVAL